MMTKRINWVDYFKALMIFCIVFGHAFAGGGLQRYVFFHVAGFFFVSGYLFTHIPGGNRGSLLF